jgi:shikimate kinase
VGASPEGAAEPVRRVVLVGFMCSGKTRVGAELAALLGWEHLDLDREIEAHEGLTVARIFARHGEPRFRELEAQATDRVAGRERVVLSPGGGWITRPSLLGRLGPGTLSVWLQVSAPTVLARAAAQPGERPLLAGPDPEGTVRRLLAERERFYAAARLAIPTDGEDPAELARRIAAVVASRETPSGVPAAPS